MTGQKKKWLAFLLAFAMMCGTFAFHPAWAEETGSDVALEDGTYKATVLIDGRQDGMLRVTDNLISVEDGKMTAYFTLAAKGFDRLYLGKADGKVDLDADETIGYTVSGERYQFWPIPIEALDKDYDISGRSARKNKWYPHRLRVESQGIEKIGDDPVTKTAEDQAEKYLNDLQKNGSILDTGSSDGIRQRGTTYTFPYYDSNMKKVNVFKLRKPDQTILKSDWYISPEDYDKFIKRRRAGKYFLKERGQEEQSFPVTLRLYSPDTEYSDIHAGSAAPIASQEFTFVLEPSPSDFQVGFRVVDKKTGEEIGDSQVKLINSQGTAMEKAGDSYTLQGGIPYDLTVTAPGYLSLKGEPEHKETFSPSDSGIHTVYMLKEADAKHTLRFKILDQEESLIIGAYQMTVKDAEGQTVDANEDGSYTVRDGENYSYSFRSEHYTEADGTICCDKDTEEIVRVEALSENYKLYVDPIPTTIPVRLQVFTTVRDGEETREVEVQPEKDGGFLLKRGVKSRYIVRADGYKDVEIKDVTGPFGADTVLHQSISMYETEKTILKKRIGKIETFKDALEEGTNPGNYAAGSKEKLNEALTAARAVLSGPQQEDAVYAEATRALDGVYRAVKKSKVAEENEISFYIHRSLDAPAELLKLTVSAGECAKYGYRKSAKAETVLLDGLLALHRQLYGDAFDAEPKNYFCYDESEYKITTLLGQAQPFNGFLINEKKEEGRNVEDVIIRRGDRIHLYMAKNWNARLLRCKEERLSVKAGQTFSLHLEETTVAKDDPFKPAAGYTVNLVKADDPSVMLSATCGSDGILAYMAQKAGEYVVQKVSRADGEQKEELIYPYVKVTVTDEEAGDTPSDKPGEEKNPSAGEATEKDPNEQSGQGGKENPPAHSEKKPSKADTGVHTSLAGYGVALSLSLLLLGAMLTSRTEKKR